MTGAKVGPAQVRFDDLALLTALDRVSDGAASSFVRRTDASLDAIRGRALSRWPVRTGKSLRSFDTQLRLVGDEIRNSLVNTATVPRWGSYVYKIRYSIFTRNERIALHRKRRRAQGWSPDAVTRSVFRLTAGWDRRGKRFPSKDETGKSPWILYVRRPAKQALKELLPDLQADINKLGRRA